MKECVELKPASVKQRYSIVWKLVIKFLDKDKIDSYLESNQMAKTGANDVEMKDVRSTVQMKKSGREQDEKEEKIKRMKRSKG
ncbi:hypothetical protein RFI_29670 [Reticulomyxa filosa]|uniref:Uncharacterized protein n=1 Tax=Reticulomyxa filosa TaxID=46433 RepID=X6M2Q6_RETFI|nr:hypothetical protein RFI_29670 [Reticulomyxa filosa]|eukprot:ETO07722.1 hypothetical protein RFI_29670 [Reticulomyxa filosa]